MATLGEFIHIVRTENRKSLDKISERAKELSQSMQLEPTGIGLSTTYFSKIERGKSKIKPEYLTFLAEIYEIDVLLLLNFFYSKEKQSLVKLSWEEDYSEIFFKGAEMVEEKTPAVDYIYRLPKFRLADSSLVILSTIIKAGSSRPPHFHRDEEIILCESGESHLIFPDSPVDDQEKLLQTGQIIHFGSNVKHAITNRSCQSAILTIIRLLPLSTALQR